MRFTGQAMQNHALPPAAPDELRPLREVFDGAGYTDRGLLEVFGPIDLPTRAGRDLAHFLHLTRQGHPLDTLIRLFLLGERAPIEAARAALDPVSLESCAGWGLLRLEDGAAAPLIRLLPFRDLLLAADQSEVLEEGGRPDQVMGITASSIALANFTVRRPARLTLDLGAGCGIQAFLAAAHSAEVIATDSCPRAVSFARFNAALNNRPNIRFLEGDLFEPVRGREFDLIVCNPPFAISPSRRYIYRDGGLGADLFSRNLVRQAPEFLAEGGYCQVICDWAQHAGEDWKERLAGWVEGTGCDAWIMRTETHTAAGYAHVWVRDTELGDPDLSNRLYREWVAYFEREGIESIGTGLIVLRRTSGRANWVRMEEAPEGMAGACGGAIALGFELRDFLDAATDERLLDERLRISPEARLDQRSECAEGNWRVASSKMLLTGGLPYVGNIDRRLANVVARCDGRRPLRDLIIHLAVELGANPEKVIPDCLALV
ncbi:MAG: class I SAM-dependent methyltransferase, partial [Acidobacteriota bacterium]